MNIIGKIEKVELLNVGEWLKPALMVTLTDKSQTYYFPVPISEINDLEIGQYKKFEINVKTIPDKKVNEDPKLTILSDKKETESQESDFPVVEDNFKFPPTSIEKEELASSEDLIEDFKPTITDEDIQSIYDVQEDAQPIIQSPKIETILDEVTSTDFEKEISEDESETEEEPVEQDPKRKRAEINIKTDLDSKVEEPSDDISEGKEKEVSTDTAANFQDLKDGLFNMPFNEIIDEEYEE